MRNWFIAITYCLICSCSSGEPTEKAAGCVAASGEEAQHLDKIPLVIKHGEQAPDHAMRVELARTAKEQEKGLQHRTDLKAGDGMLFPMFPPRMPNFWMKDTPSPLDLIFIRTDGSVERIVKNTQPNDRTPLFTEVPVSAVLELPAGQVDALALDEGDRIHWGACTQTAQAAPIAEADNFCPG
ncbi:MAG: DUF192 domain-containing protein [Sphingobium sp.]